MIVVKHNYISSRDRQSRGKGKPPKLAAVGRALAHVKYIQHRPGEDRGDGGREFFNDEEEGLDSKDLRAAIKEMKDAKVVVHRITLAPEINPGDKKQFTREVMAQLGREKGLDLKWMAVEHDNTDHHHIHVVVLGKDKNGTDVRIDKKDYDILKEYGDRYLERCHPLELQKSREERERKERERVDARRKERDSEREQRIQEGLELPWIHKKIVREMYEPYEKWKERQEKPAPEPREEPEKPYFQDTIEAAGKDWSKLNSLSELKELNQYLWDHYDERIAPDEYKKLLGWIRDKERLAARPKDKAPGSEKSDAAQNKEVKKDSNSFEYKGQNYSKDTPYEKLSELSKNLRENKKDRLPVDDYQRLRQWIEHADRARWSGVLEKQMQLAKQQEIKREAQRNSPDNYRYINPLQQQFMKNPVVGMFMQGASIANQLVRWIPLDDKGRDFNKEAIQDLEEAKKAAHRKALDKGETGGGGEAQDVINKLNKDIDQKLDEKKQEEDEKKKQKKKNPFERDQWGRH